VNLQQNENKIACCFPVNAILVRCKQQQPV